MRKVYDVVPQGNKSTKQKNTAKAVARKGRRGDSALVHVSPGEVKALRGLAALTGGKMTTNPDTGLPEAFSLKKALKLVVPIAASIIGTPALGAAVSAGMTKADGGSWKEALTSGVTSLALSGAAGAAGKAFSGAAPAATGAAGAVGTQGIAAAAPTAATGVAEAASAQGIAAAAPAATTGAAVAPSLASSTMNAAKAAMPYMSVAQATNGMEQQQAQQRMDETDDMYARRRGQAILAAGLDQSQYHYAEGGAVNTPAAAVPTARGTPWGVDTSAFVGQAFKPAFDFHQYTPPAPAPAVQPAVMTPAVANKIPGRLSLKDFFGGKNLGQILGGNSARKRAVDAEAARVLGINTANAARGDLASFGPTYSPYEQAFGSRPTVFNSTNDLTKYFADGGAVTGPGDGMSDGIAAVIDEQHPAKIASGEYILPADIVSHLGNGDTNAGINYLDAQMKAIRQASVGNSKQRNRINPHDFIG
jgi:hypothetical protein